MLRRIARRRATPTICPCRPIDPTAFSFLCERVRRGPGASGILLHGTQTYQSCEWVAIRPDGLSAASRVRCSTSGRTLCRSGGISRVSKSLSE
jgi:hypothetical protein